jgi:hypothetical protein
MTGARKPASRNPFTIEEDRTLRALVQRYGQDNWELVTSHMPNRNVRQCKERWNNFIGDCVCRDQWSQKEDSVLLEKYQQFGAKWKFLEIFLSGRKSYAIRNRLHLLLRKMGLVDGLRPRRHVDYVQPAVPNVSDRIDIMGSLELDFEDLDGWSFG